MSSTIFPEQHRDVPIVRSKLGVSCVLGKTDVQKFLPLTPFEELMLHQDSSAYPASCFLRLTFAGRLDETAFREAAQLTIARHPLLHATIGKDRDYHWVQGDVMPAISWNEGEQSTPQQCSRLNIEEEHAVRFIVRVHDDSSEVLIQFHHSACDGIGIYQVIRDLLISYTAAVPDGADIAPPPLNPDLLAGRGATGLTGLRRMKLIAQQAARIPAVCNFFLNTPLPVVPSDRLPIDAPGPECSPLLYSHHFAADASSQIRSSASGRGTLNDLLTRDLFLATREFRRWQQLPGDNGSLRFMIPINLRSVEQFRASAANMIGAVFLDRRLKVVRDPDVLLKSIGREMDHAKRLKLGHLFNFALAAHQKIPGGLKRLAWAGRRQISAVFTNLGRVLTNCPLPRLNGQWVCGNVILRSTEAAAPIAPDVATAFAATWYANRLTLTLHADSRILSSAAAQKMLSLFVSRVRTSAGLTSTSQTSSELAGAIG